MLQERSNAANVGVQRFINERYGFDNANGGKKLQARLKAIANNPVSKKKRKVLNTVSLLAKRDNLQPADVALKLLKKDGATLKGFLKKKGIKAHSSFVGMAIQADAARNADIESIAKQLNIPHADAELILEHAEAELLNDNNADADEFLGGLAGIVKNVAKKGLDKLSQAKTGKTTAQIKEEATKKGGGLGAWLDTIIGGVKNVETKKTIKEYLPYIIVGLLALIAVTVFVTRAASKK